MSIIEELERRYNKNMSIIEEFEKLCDRMKNEIQINKDLSFDLCIMYEKDAIKKIVDECEKSELYTNSEKARKEYWKGINEIKEETKNKDKLYSIIFSDLLNKINNRLTDMHMYGIIVLLLPLVYKAIVENK